LYHLSYPFPLVYPTSPAVSRRRLIGYAIDARKQRFLNEKPFVYQPLADTDDTLRWDKEAKDKIKDYNLLDFSI